MIANDYIDSNTNQESIFQCYFYSKLFHCYFYSIF